MEIDCFFVHSLNNTGECTANLVQPSVCDNVISNASVPYIHLWYHFMKCHVSIILHGDSMAENIPLPTGESEHTHSIFILLCSIA